MLVEADANKKSGPGTSMFSRTGASTINQHKAFTQNQYSNVNELIYDKKNPRTRKRESVAGTDEGQFAGSVALPAITEGDQAGPVVHIPGLAKELARLEKTYKVVQKDQSATKKIQQASKMATTTGFGANAPSATAAGTSFGGDASASGTFPA